MINCKWHCRRKLESRLQLNPNLLLVAENVLGFQQHVTPFAFCTASQSTRPLVLCAVLTQPCLWVCTTTAWCCAEPCCAVLCALLQATFVVEIEAPSDLTVLSNSPTASTRWILNNATSSVSRTTFQPTPVMSTYLLSIAVGELKAVTARTSR